MTAVHAANRSPDLGALTGQYREAHNRTDRECARSPWLLRSLRVLSTVGSDACRSCLTTLWPRDRSSGLHRSAVPDGGFRNRASSNFSPDIVSGSGSTDFAEGLVKPQAEVAGDDFLLDLGGAAEDEDTLIAAHRALTLIIHAGRWLPRGVPRTAATAEILASGYDCGPAGGPGAGGFHRPQRFPP